MLSVPSPYAPELEKIGQTSSSSLSKANGTRYSTAIAVFDVILERTRETVVGEAFAEFDDADDECNPGQLVGDLS